MRLLRMMQNVRFISHLVVLSLSLNSRLVSRRLSRREINFKAYIQSTLKRTTSIVQSSLDDFVFEPGNLFQGNCES